MTLNDAKLLVELGLLDPVALYSSYRNTAIFYDPSGLKAFTALNVEFHEEDYPVIGFVRYDRLLDPTDPL